MIFVFRLQTEKVIRRGHAADRSDRDLPALRHFGHLLVAQKTVLALHFIQNGDEVTFRVFFFQTVVLKFYDMLIAFLFTSLSTML